MAVALSGGADSVALLRALYHHKSRLGGAGQLLALHVNHQLRGDESAEDARWCQELCDSFGLSIEVLACDTSQYAADTGDGIEAAARAQRYDSLIKACESSGVRYLATAHTRDDQVETVLFRILRGTGLRGLAGIPTTRLLTESLTLIRPLLNCSREGVIRYLTGLGQEYRSDSSNIERQFSRNRLRHDLLPLLRENYNADLDSALLRLAEQSGEAQHLIEIQAQSLLHAAGVSAKPQSVSLTRHVFEEQPPLIVCEALRIVWREAGLAEQAMTFEWWRRLCELAQKLSAGKALNLPGNVRASVAGDRLMLQW